MRAAVQEGVRDEELPLVGSLPRTERAAELVARLIVEEQARAKRLAAQEEAERQARVRFQLD